MLSKNLGGMVISNLDKSEYFKSRRNRTANLFYQMTFNDKWTEMVISCLYHKAKGFNELLADLYISPSNLSKILKVLEKYRLIERTVLPTRPVSVKYSLTECGIDFVETIGFTHAKFVQKWFLEEEYMGILDLNSLLRREPAPENIPEKE